MDSPTQFGSYQIIRKVGAGGMADVYEAVRVGLANFQTRVALKCILPSMTRDDRFVRMFINEAHLGSQLHHPNIIQIQDFNKIAETYYIAMEFVEGVDLARIIKRLAIRKVSFPPSVVIDLATQALAGLAYAHDAKTDDGDAMNIIHRDVKPSNFIITPTGVVKIGDFGIAKAANLSSSHSLTGDQIKGTINYMSPEQIDGVSLTPSSDLFSLGAILFEMLLLRHLFDGPTMSAILLKIAMVNIEKDLELVRTRYPAFLPILNKALSRAPEDRYQKGPEMAEDLRHLGEQLGSGLSLRDFLSMHPDLFAPPGSLPGEDEDSHDPLSMMVTPVQRFERPDIIQLQQQQLSSHSFEVDDAPSFEIEMPSELELPIVAESEPSSSPQVDFTYYPPGEEAGEGGEESGGSSVSGWRDAPAEASDSWMASDPTPIGDPTTPGPWEEDLSSAAQRLLPAEDGTEEVERATIAQVQELTELDASAPPQAVSDELDDEPFPDDMRPYTLRQGLWAAFLITLFIATGVLWHLNRGESAVVLEGGPPATAVTDAARDATTQHVSSGAAGELARLAISSEPAGATITLNGVQLQARTPTELDLPTDKRSASVILALKGYQSVDRTLTYETGQKLVLTPTLIPLPTTGSISVDTRPPGAEIVLNGQPTGKRTPNTLTNVVAGDDHRLSVTLRGYQRARREVSVQVDGTTPVFIRLRRTGTRTTTQHKQGHGTNNKTTPSRTEARPVPTDTLSPPKVTPMQAAPIGVAILVVNTVPPDAEVYIDGKKYGEVPQRISITSGKHTVVFRAIDNRKSIDIDLTPGEERKVVWDISENRWLAR